MRVGRSPDRSFRSDKLLPRGSFGPDFPPMSLAARRRPATRAVHLDRSLEALPLFKLSDSAEDAAISFTAEIGGPMARVAGPRRPPARHLRPGRLLRVLHRFMMRARRATASSRSPCMPSCAPWVVAWMGAPTSSCARRSCASSAPFSSRPARTAMPRRPRPAWAVHDAVTRCPSSDAGPRDREQLTLFSTLTATEPGTPASRSRRSPREHRRGLLGYARARSLSGLSSPVARRLYRLLEVARAEGSVSWRVALDRLAEQLPLSQRYPSHLQRVLQPAHEMLVAAGILRDASFKQQRRAWFVDYVLASKLG